ncbi:hypothetical protein [Catellatospora sichuanensis]|uniref:hypothetical protein n=1 Tax=Catellatospora sichuanensis TaxID=1969805 RepID=UPI0011841396|nr:hypothetical protein [Catellatospora sichuanensis]
MRALLVRAVLALYPAAIRDRYGDEIAELLHASPAPGRDLADTAWCALRDRLTHRAETMTMAQARTAAWTMLRLLGTPSALGVLMLALISTMGVLANLGKLYEFGGYMYAAATVLSVPPAWLFGRWMARTRPIPAVVFAVPVALGLGVAAIAVLPGFGQVMGEESAASLTAIACWAAGAALLAYTLRVLLRNGRSAAARVVGVAGGVLLPAAATAVYVLAALPAERAPRRFAPLWWVSSVSGWDPGLVDDAYRQLEDVIKLLPQMLTLCTVFVLAVVSVTASRPRIAAESA